MIQRILSTTLILAALGAMLGFAAAEVEGRRVQKVDIQVKDMKEVGFLDADRIEGQLGATRLEGELLNDVDLQLILSHLTDMDACERAEVYAQMNGTVHIDVWQRHPVLRVHVSETGNDHYLDESGRRMPLDAHFTPHVPVMHVQRETQAHMGFRFVTATKDDAFWNALTDQLSMNKDGELILHPRLAGHEVILGDASNCAHKKRNLLAFYRAQVKRGNLRNYKRIDLTYRDQVIAQRYP
ncbi:MAG: hypothetical protein VYA72_03555 [Bacteroidota bacterium]|nr:hypothetical protein [Bacteroidota bacterium]